MSISYFIARCVSKMRHNRGQEFWHVCQYDPHAPADCRRITGAVDEEVYPFVWGFERLDHAVEVLRALEAGGRRREVEALAERLANVEKAVAC